MKWIHTCSYVYKIIELNILIRYVTRKRAFKVKSMINVKKDSILATVEISSKASTRWRCWKRPKHLFLEIRTLKHTPTIF